MQDIDIDKLINVMEKPQTATTFDSVMNAMNETEKVLKQFENIINIVDRMGLKPLLVRGVGVKLGIDAESPLRSEKGVAANVTGTEIEDPKH